MVRQTEKQGRLVEAAKGLLHRQGVQRTTLADIAREAEIPLGNLYYYFRTKEALLDAVIEAHSGDLHAAFARWECDPNPRRRVRAFLDEEAAASDMFARFGCPYGSLCQELEKDDTQLASSAARLLRMQLEWLEHQFRLLGEGEHAPALALDLLATLQGAYLLTNTFRDPSLLTRQIKRLEVWLDTVGRVSASVAAS